MPLDFSLSNQAQLWLYQNNVEGVVCELPTLEDVMAGQHWIMAVGNDGMGAKLAVETEWCREHADSMVTLVHFSYLSLALRRMRYEEVTASERMYG